MFTMFTMFIRPLLGVIYRVNIGVNIAEKFTVHMFTPMFTLVGRVNVGQFVVFPTFTATFTA